MKRYLRSKYEERAAYIDRVLNDRLLEPLEADMSHARDVIIVAGDHGEEFLEHGGIFHGSTLYEEAIKVPVVLRDGQSRGIHGEPIELRDVAHTIMEVAGFRRAPRPALTLRTRPDEDRVVVSVMPNGLVGVRKGRYKSVMHYFTNAQVLFDLAQDPGETRDISGERPDVAAQFRRLTDSETRRIIKR